MFKIGNRAIYQSSIQAAIGEAKKHSFVVLEIHLTSPQFLLYNYSEKQLAEIKSFSKEQGITLQLHAPLEQSLIFISPELRQAAKDQIEKMVEFGQEIGARCLTLHPGKATVYHTSGDEKLKNDELFPKFYSDLFEDSIKHIISIAAEDIFICVENTDNFTLQYQKVLDKYLLSGKLFLTWDIRKNYSYTTNELIQEQWEFVKRNKEHVKNLHISGFGAAHGEIKEWGEKLNRFIDLFNDKNLSLVIEIMPLEHALEAKRIINNLLIKNYPPC